MIEDIMKLLKNLNNSCDNPYFYFKSRKVNKTTIFDFFVKKDTPYTGVHHLKNFLGDVLPENAIPGYFVSYKLLSNMSYVFSIKTEGLMRSDIRQKSDLELMEFLKDKNIESIDYFCDKTDIDPIELNRIYSFKVHHRGILVGRLLEIHSYGHYRMTLLKSNDKEINSDLTVGCIYDICPATNARDKLSFEFYDYSFH